MELIGHFLYGGGVHGAASVAENIIDKQSRKRKARSKLKWLKLIAVFIFCSFAWIFFRSENINEAIYIINNSLTGITDPLDYIMIGIADLGIGKMKLSACIATISILLIYDYSSLKTDVIEAIGRRSIFIRWPVYYGILLWIFIMSPNAGNQFVYFQF